MVKDQKKEKQFLTCEKKSVYFSLIFVAGILGAYSYIVRGHVFCNAQTGNVVMMGIALGSAKWKTGFYYLIPMSAYIMGSFISELVPNPFKHRFPIRWDTFLIVFEMIVVVILGFIPTSVPVQISQVLINFTASMQYNTFRQAEGIPVATTFVTNHIRQIGVGLAKELRHRNSKDKKFRKKWIRHVGMLFFFAMGTIVGAFFCNLFQTRAIWIALVPLGILFADFLRADLIIEKDMVEAKPSGH